MENIATERDNIGTRKKNAMRRIISVPINLRSHLIIVFSTVLAHLPVHPHLIQNIRNTERNIITKNIKFGAHTINKPSLVY